LKCLNPHMLSVLVSAAISGKLLEVNSRLNAKGSLLFDRQAMIVFSVVMLVHDAQPFYVFVHMAISLTIACLDFPLSPVREGHLAIIYLTSAEVKMLNETLTTRDAYLELRGLKPEDLN